MAYPLKATNEQIIAAYQETGSVWQAGLRLDMVGQSVWERLRAIGYPMASRRWTAAEIEELKVLVATCTLTDIATRLGRPYLGVAGKISELGIGTRFGNRIKRKVPRGSGLTKPVVSRLVKDLDGWTWSIKQFCRARGLSIDMFALAVQTYEPETWRLIAWRRGLEEKTCPECSATFYPMTSKQVACTRRCAGANRRNKSYFGGRRMDAIGMRDGICQLCLVPKKSLSAHHILGKENDEDNEHLIALCAGCHKLVGLAATRKVLDSDAGWERFIELVMARRLADQDGQFIGTHVCVDVEYLTADEFIEMGLVEELPIAAQTQP